MIFELVLEEKHGILVPTLGGAVRIRMCTL